jgi:hypothetical protein
MVSKSSELRVKSLLCWPISAGRVATSRGDSVRETKSGRSDPAAKGVFA